VTGGSTSGKGAAVSCTPQEDGSHPTYANSKLTEEYSKGYTRVINYSTQISANGGGSCPAPTSIWTPPLLPGVDPGTKTSSVWSEQVTLSDVRTQARSELVWNEWGTPPDFAMGASVSDAGRYAARWVVLGGGEAFVRYQNSLDAISLFSIPGSSFDFSNSDITGAQMNASVQRQQVKFTLGPPKLPMKLKWNIVKTSDFSVVSSDEVLLTPGSPTYTADVFAEESSGTGQSSVTMKNLHIFACPYHG
jgi:hypothetical protein